MFNNSTLLPNELKVLIFKKLDRSTLNECMYVCKAWNFPATQLYYKDLWLNGSMIHRLKASHQRKLAINHGTQVRCLFIHKDHRKSHFLRIKDFTYLISQLPHLKTLDFSESRKELIYYQNLESKTFDRKSTNNDTAYLQNLEQIVSSRSYRGTGYAFYGLCLQKFKEQITALEIDITFRGIGSYSFNKYHPISSLSQFVCLTRLTIWGQNSYHSGNERRRGIKICMILRWCPRLVEFKVNSMCHIDANDTVDSLLQETGDGNGNNAVVGTDASWWDLTVEDRQQKFLQTYCPALKSLDLCFFNSFPMKHLSSYIPLYLDYLQLQLQHTIFDQWESENGVQALEALGNQLRFVRESIVSVTTCKYYNPSAANQTSSQDFTDYLAKFVNAMTQGRQVICHLKVTLCSDSYNSAHGQPLFYMKKAQDILSIECVFFVGDIYKDDYVLPSLLGGDIEGVNQEVKKLAFNVHWVNAIVTNFSLPIMNKLLNNIMAQYPNFNGCSVVARRAYAYYELKSRNERPSTQNDGKTYDGVFSQHHIDQFNNGLLSTCSNVTSAEAYGIEISPEYMDILSRRLPHLKHINLKDCRFQYDEFKNITIDISNIQHLQTFKLDVRHLSITKSRPLFIQVEYHNNEDPVIKEIYVCKMDRAMHRFNVELKEPAYLESHNRFQNANKTVFIVKVANIDQFLIYQWWHVPEGASLFNRMTEEDSLTEQS